MDFEKLRINISCKRTLQILSYCLSYENANYLNSFKYSDLRHIDLFRNRAVSLMTATENEIKIEITRNVLNISF